VGGVTKTDYCSTTFFTSTDPTADMPFKVLGSLYSWSSDSVSGCVGAPSDNGVRLFVSVVLRKIGMQSIVANDTMSGAITGLTAVKVVGADVKLVKTPPLALASSGEGVQFRICWSNYSSATAFSFTITDAVPMGTRLVPETRENLVCGVPAGVGMDVAYSANPSVTAPSDFTTLAPASGVPAMDVRWLRWTVRDVGVNSSGCVCFKVSVY